MASSLSNLVDNLTEEIHKITCNDCNWFLDYESANDNSTNHQCLTCNENHSKKIDENLKNWFKNIIKLSNDINKFILLLRKGVDPYDFIDD